MTGRSASCNARCIRTGVAAALLLSAAPLWAADGTRLGIGADYSRGDYGSTLDTGILSVPVSLQVRRGRWQFDASLPWLRVSGDRNVVPGMGVLGTGLLGDGAAGTERRTTAGVGDLTLATRYAVDTSSKLGIAIGARAKVATADATRGLGTGANDYGISLDLYRRVGDTLLFAGAGHDWLGDSPRIQAGTQQRGSVGFSHAAGNGQWGLKYEQRSALAEHVEGRRDATVFYNGGSAGDPGLRLSLSRGLSDDSPDWGVGIGMAFDM